jgi:hypothetical protein
MRIRQKLVFLAMLTLGVAVLPHVSPVSADPRSSTGSAAKEDDTRFRGEVGLRIDKAYLRELREREQAGANDLDRSYGALLTKAEAQELRDRGRIATANAAAVRAFFSESSGLFGGMYLDHHDGGTLVVLVTGEAERLTHDLRTVVPDVARTRIATVAHSVAALDALNQHISGDIAAMQQEGVELTGVGTDERANTVTVDVASLTPSVRDVLARRYRSAPLTVREGPRATTNGLAGRNAPPFRGAQYIDDVLNVTCSNGLIARAPGAIGNRYYVVTAGHCGIRNWTQAGYPEGRSEVNLFYSGSNTDAMRIPISVAEMSREIYLREGNYQIITQSEGYQADYVTQIVCASGYQTEITCGTILERNFTANYADRGVTLYNQRLTTYRTTGGDSGGSVFDLGLAKGIHSGSRTWSDGRKEGIYSQVSEVMSALGLSTATSCEGALTPYCR